MKILNIMLSRNLGGIEQAFLNYNNMLKAEGASVVNVVSCFSEISKYVDANYKLLNLGNWDLVSIQVLKTIINKEKPDIILCHGGRACKFVYKAGKPKSSVSVGIMHGDKLKWIEKCDHIFTLTQKMEAFAKKEGINSKRLHLMPNAIDISDVRIKDKNENETTPVIATMGRFVHKKGIDVFLESLSMLKEEGLQFRAIIGGHGEEEDYLKSICKKLGLEHYVEFTGWVEDKSEFFNEIDIFCLPSRAEPFGIIVLEAMAHKVPVIATYSNGPSEIIEDGKDGILIDIDSAKQMADAIAVLANDDKLAKQLIEKATLKIKEQYDFKVISKRLIETLNKVIK